MVHGNVTTQPLQWQAEETNLSPSKSKFSCTFEDGKKKKKKWSYVLQHTVSSM